MHPLQRRFFIILFFAIVSLAIMAPIATSTDIPDNIDLGNHLASIIQAKMALKEGQFLLRVAPYEHEHMRYALFQFNSPTSYTFAGLIHFITKNPFIAYKLTLWLSSLLGALFLYRFISERYPSRIVAMLATLVYVTAPLHLILINRMGAFNEMIAQGLLPIVLYCNFSFFKKTENKMLFLFSALTWYVLITTHLITFVYFSLFFGLFLLLLTKEQSLNDLIKVAIAYAFGALLAMWYLAPSALLGNFLKIQATLITLSKYNYFTPLAALLSPSATSPFPIHANYLPIDHFAPLNPALGWPTLLAVGIACYLFTTKQNVDRIATPLLILFFICFFFTWSPFNIWNHVPKFLLIGQYSWRLLGQITWMGALLFASSVFWLFKHKLDERHLIVGTLLLTISTASWLPVIANSSLTLAHLLTHPGLGFSRDDYLLDIDKYPAMASFIESFSLKKENTPEGFVKATLPAALLENAMHPQLIISGNVVQKKQTQLHVLLNENSIANKTFPPGTFVWTLPLHKEIKSKKETYSLTFKTNGKITLDDLLFKGFLESPTAILTNETKNRCHQEKMITVCNIKTSDKTQYINLPIIFYPRLLDVVLNGKSVSYFPVLYGNFPVVGLHALPNTQNHIEIRFRGLSWANWVSAFAWLLWLLYFFHLSFKAIKHSN